MTVNLYNIKETFQTIMQTANTTTASHDLSSNMVNRVRSVLKTNIEKISPQASLFPLVTIFVDSKAVELKGMAKNQSTCKREGRVEFKILGSVWNSNYVSYDEDPADNDCEYLMENIEENLRINDNLNGTVLWGVPTDIVYFSHAIDEDCHLRTGIMSYQTRIYY